jgi:hypothetical protein
MPSKCGNRAAARTDANTETPRARNEERRIYAFAAGIQNRSTPPLKICSQCHGVIVFYIARAVNQSDARSANTLTSSILRAVVRENGSSPPSSLGGTNATRTPLASRCCDFLDGFVRRIRVHSHSLVRHERCPTHSWLTLCRLRIKCLPTESASSKFSRLLLDSKWLDLFRQQRSLK